MEGTTILTGLDQKAYFSAVWEQDDAETAEQMQEEHERPYKALFDALTAGKINAFDFCRHYGAGGQNWYIVARSTRPGILVQMSVVWLRASGEMVPLSHCNINSFADFRPEIPQDDAAVHWLRLAA